MVGFSYVIGDLIIIFDVDFQNLLEEIFCLVVKVDEGYDVVGIVCQNCQDSWFCKIVLKMINWFIQCIIGKVMGDYGCMLCVYCCYIVDVMLYCYECSIFILILVNIFVCCVIEILVYYVECEFGEFKYSFMCLINLMYDLVICFIIMLLCMLSLFGSIIVIGGFSIVVLLVILCLIFGL